MSEPTPAQRAIGDFAPKLVALTDDVLFGDIWERSGLAPRDRSLVTVAALIANGSHRAAARQSSQTRPARTGSPRRGRRRPSPTSRSTPAGRGRCAPSQPPRTFRRRRRLTRTGLEGEPTWNTVRWPHRRPGQPAVPRRHDVRPVGQRRPRRQLRIIHRALDAGINFIDTADVYSARRLRGDRRQGARRPPRRRRPGHEVLHADGRGPEPRRRLPPLDHPGGRELAAAAGHRLHRPVPGAPARPDTDVEETLGALTDLVRQGKVRYIGSSSYSGSQIVEAQWASRERQPGAVRHRAAARTRSSSAASRRTCCPPRSGTAWEP